MHEVDEKWMRQAIEMARDAAEIGEVPVGAIIIDSNGGVLAAASNLTIKNTDPTAHAELIALREASRRLGSWRLEEATVVVTLEPCAMCASALVQARVKRVVYAASEPKTGAHQSVHRFFEGTATEVVQDEASAPRSAELLASFFQKLREREGGENA